MSESTPRRRIGRVASDLVMLVVGILIALAADASWDGRQERREVEAIVEALRAELEQNRAHLSQRGEDHAAMTAQTTRLTGILHGAEPAPSDEETATLVLSVMGGTTTSQSFGAYDVLLARGTAEGVPTEFLVDLAAHVHASRQGASLTDLAASDFTLERLAGVIQAHGGVLGLMGSETRGALGLPPARTSTDLRGLLNDPEFVDAVTVMSMLYRNRAAWIAARLAETEALLAALE